MTIGKRLRWLRKKAGLNQEQLAALSGVGQTTISNLERDVIHKPRVLGQLAPVFNANLNWIMREIGPIYLDEASQKANEIASTQEGEVEIPLLDWKQTSDWLSGITTIPKRSLKMYIVDKSKIGKKTFAIEMTDDSMISDKEITKSIMPGEFLIINAAQEATNGNYIFIQRKEDYMVGKYIKNVSTHRVEPLNSKYNSIDITPEIKIIGVIVGKWSEMP